MQALTKGAMTVLGGEPGAARTSTSTISSTCICSRSTVGSPGVYNAGFENLTRPRDRAARSPRASPARSRSCRRTIRAPTASCSDRLLATGFAPTQERRDGDRRDGRGVLPTGRLRTSRASHNVTLDEAAQPGMRPREQEDSRARRRRRRLVDGVLPHGERLRRHRRREEQPRRRPGAHVLLQRPPVRVRPAHLVLARRRGRSDQPHDRRS